MIEIETLDFSDVAKTIDHSLLRPELDTDTVLAGVQLALRYDVIMEWSLDPSLSKSICITSPMSIW